MERQSTSFKCSLFLLLCLTGLQLHAAPLCPQAANKANYHSDFLENFLYLQTGNEQWLFRDTDLKTSFGPGRSGLKYISKLNAALEKWGVTLVMVPIPTRGITHPEYLGDITYDSEEARKKYTQYLKGLRGAGVSVPELDNVFNTQQSKPLFFARDHHWTTAGAKKFAKLTSNKIKTLAVYKKLSPSQFSTTRVGNIKNNGSHAKAARLMCQMDFDNEVIARYVTEDISEKDPFADIPAPEVVLVGTSNSEGKLDFNFAGYLRQYLNTDVLNMAQSGGGYDGAITDYLNSELFREQPPKILIWEVPGYYSLNTHSFYKNLLEGLRP